jgi:hypothetical protein
MPYVIMKILVAVVVLLVAVVAMNYPITGNVVAGEEESSGFFGKVWSFFTGFFDDEDDETDSVDANADVSVIIFPGDVEDLKASPGNLSDRGIYEDGLNGPSFGCTEDAKICSDGSVVVRVGEDCEFEACPKTDLEVSICSKASRGVDACLDIYDPVCADVQVECFAAPCYPVKQNYPNGCNACMNDRVESYVDGVCGAEM